MKPSTSRVATLVGLLGLVMGALLGAFADNFLERGRNFEKSVYDREAKAIRQMLASSERGPNGEINAGRKLLAITADKETVLAIREWMIWEKRTEKRRGITKYRTGKMFTCNANNQDPEDIKAGAKPAILLNPKDLDDRMKINFRLRQSMRGEGRGWFDWLPHLGGKELNRKQVWEVFQRCLFPESKA